MKSMLRRRLMGRPKEGQRGVWRSRMRTSCVVAVISRGRATAGGAAAGGKGAVGGASLETQGRTKRSLVVEQDADDECSSE